MLACHLLRGAKARVARCRSGPSVTAFRLSDMQMFCSPQSRTMAAPAGVQRGVTDVAVIGRNANDSVNTMLFRSRAGIVIV